VGPAGKIGLAALIVAALYFAWAQSWPESRQDPLLDHRETAARATESSHTIDLDQLRAIGYVDFATDLAQSEAHGVVASDPSRISPGYNLYVERTERRAHLVDNTGEILHTWQHPGDVTGQWEHAVMFPNGDLVAILKFREVLRLDWDSKLIWRRQLDVHHEIATAPDGSLYVLSRDIRNYRGLQVQFPIVVHLTGAGELLDEWRGIDHLNEIQRWLEPRFLLDTLLDQLEDRGEMEAYLESHRDRYDYFHSNTITVLPETPLGEHDPRFRAGNLMLCLRNVDQILILDAEDMQIVWSWGASELEHPHHPTMLDNGNVLIFDNGTRRRYSRVIEVDPASGEIVWQYVADPPEQFFSEQKGSAQRLPNGNTLICQGDSGRSFEVTPGGEVVWDWRTQVNQEGHRAALYRMLRMEPHDVDPLLIESK
jgi:hypothetical protein